MATAEEQERLGGRASLRRFLLVVRQAFRLVWNTDRRAFLTIIILQVLNGIGLGVELLVGKRLLDSIGSNGSGRPRGSLEDIVPELIALGVIALFIAIGAAVSAARSDILSEAVSRRVQGEVLDVTSA